MTEGEKLAYKYYGLPLEIGLKLIHEACERTLEEVDPYSKAKYRWWLREVSDD